MDATRLMTFVDGLWERSIVPTLFDYIRIPNKSPGFDPSWAEHGHMERAVRLVADWCRAQPVEGLVCEIVRLPGRTPLLYLEVPGDASASPEDCVLLYGHYDKQPEMSGWAEGLSPFEPVLRGDRLYGRGGADDGYAAFASLTALHALQVLGERRARCVILIEGCEESGSFDLPAYIEHLSDRIGRPSLVVCLDSGCGNYEQLWTTTSLRGRVGGTLGVRILEEGVHAGDASGVVPSSFRIARALLSRVEDEATGRILLPELWTEIPPERIEQASRAAAVLGDTVFRRFPFPSGAGPYEASVQDLILNRTWRPFLEITGAEGLPEPRDAGNVLRPKTALLLSLRTPPTLDTEIATRAVKEALERDPPHGAEVTFVADPAFRGWNAPLLAPWLEQSLEVASSTYFGRPAAHMGEGGSIPFMGMLGAKFPDAQFMIAGVLGPSSNAHGPNEFLHIPMAKRLTACVAEVVRAHFQREA